MRTKNEIFDALLNFLDTLAICGVLTKDDMEYIDNLEFEYYSQSKEDC